MHISQIASLFASMVAMAQAFGGGNTVTFQSLDDLDRTIYFTPNAGLAWLPSVEVPAGTNVAVEFPHAWIGNWFGVVQGQPQIPGMLGEVAFNGWNDMHYYDVSAIVNPADVDNVSELYPEDDPNKPVSGCRSWPCNNAYWLPDDVQTKVTTQNRLVCTLSRNGRAAKRDELDYDTESVSHGFVFGKY